jgi:hypothetical protein
MMPSHKDLVAKPRRVTGFNCDSIGELAASAFRQCAGKSLAPELDGCDDVPKALWTAPIACLVVADPPVGGGEDGADAAATTADAAGAAAGGGESVCVYANLAALEAHGVAPGEPISRLIGARSALPARTGGGKPYESGYSKKVRGGVQRAWSASQERYDTPYELGDSKKVRGGSGSVGVRNVTTRRTSRVTRRRFVGSGGVGVAGM